MNDHRWLALAIAICLVAIAVVGATVTAPPRVDQSIPGERLDVDVDRDFSSVEQEAGNDLGAAVRPWALAVQVLALGVALALGLSPWGASIVRGISTMIGDRPWWALVLGTLALLLIGRLLTLPFAVMARRPSVAAGLSTQSWLGWAADVGKAFLVSAVVVLVGVIALRALALASPGWWWAWAASLAGVAVVVMSFLLPVLVEPLFNRFTSLPDGALRTSLIELAADEGVTVDDVLVADASRRTTSLNAYVSGLGTSRRLVVYDNLLTEATPAEVRSVVAHEVGHAADNDVRNATVWGAFATAGGVALLGFMLTWPGLLRRADAMSVTDPAVVALVLAIVTVFTVVATPVSNAVSRRVEARADVRALDATRDPLALVQVQRRLALTNKSDLTPPALIHAWWGSHPTAPERIGLARAWARANGLDPIPPQAGVETTRQSGSTS